ncbi:MAG: molybdate ABC transporter substrate-binding protein [Ginsengibacter sp.]
MGRTTLLVFFCLMAFTACHEKESSQLKIAVAANMQFTMKELATSFTAETGITCDLIVGSSGQLTAQIRSGAPYDVFVSADMKYPGDLFTAGYTADKPAVYAFGKLVMWSMIDSIKPTIDILTTPDVTHIAIANPTTAPYGMAAIAVLNHHHVYEDLKSKLVYGESISQTNQFIISKSAEVGFTAKSVVLSPELKGKGKWTDIDEADYSPIAQGIVVLRHGSAQPGDAEKFYNFLFSEKAKDILQKFGYAVK